VPIAAEPGVSAVLQRARYRFDPSWLAYYLYSPLASYEIISGGAANTYSTYDQLGRQLFVSFTAKFRTTSGGGDAA